MKRLEAYPLWAALLLPLLAAMSLNLFPRALVSEVGLTQARFFVNAGEPAAAYPFLLQAAKASRDRADLWEQAGQAAWQAGLVDQAIDALTKAQSLGGMSHSATLNLGDAYRQKGDLAAALETWQALLENPVSSIEGFKRIEAVYFEGHEWQALMQLYQRHVELDPQNGAILFHLAELSAIYDPENALRWAERAVQSNSAFQSAKNTLQAGLILADGQADLAYRWTLIGRTLASLETWELAAEAFQRAVEANPEYGEAWAFLGEARQQLGQDATAELTRAEELSPDSLLVQALQAIRWRRLGQPERALVYLHAAADQEPDNPIWQVELGGTVAQIGNLAEALTYFQAAIRIKPQDPAYYRQLAAFCVQYNYQVQPEGVEAARQASLINPQDPQNQDILGQIYLRLGDMINAERFFLKAIDLAPDYAASFLHLGILYLQGEKNSLAQVNLQKVIALRPNTNLAQQAERILQVNFPDDPAQ